MQTCSEYTT